MTQPKTKNLIADKLLNVKVNNNPVKEYTYDDCGRLIAVESSAGVASLSWDYEDRLIGTTYPNQSTNSFGYNGFGARVLKTDSTGNYTFMRNGTGVTASVLSDSYAEYTPGISERRSSNLTYYHSDLKNATTQTNSIQNISGTNQYDAFGNLVNYTGDWSGPFSYGGAFGYQTDDDSGLMLLGHRYYDPSTGRFFSRDSAKDGSNWYAYCRNNPLKFADPTGNVAFLLAPTVAKTMFGLIAFGVAALAAWLYYGSATGRIPLPQLPPLPDDAKKERPAGPRVDPSPPMDDDSVVIGENMRRVRDAANA